MTHPSLRTLASLAVGSLLFLNISTAFAASGDLYITSGNVWFADSTVVYGQTVRIYSTVSNDTGNDLLGSVQFLNQTTGNAIGSDQPISVLAGKTDTVFVDWTPSAGTYTIKVTVYPWDTTSDDSSNNSQNLTTTVDYDNDVDGVGNAQDPNDDNDDANDTDDAFPFDANETKDTDTDGTGDNTDTDDDGDGIADSDDELPQDATESADTDGDGVGDNTDEDDDNDGLSDSFEITAIDPETGEDKETTDPTVADTDGDGVLDGPGVSTPNGESETTTNDVFPNDSNESSDSDQDGVGDNTDEDDDNDGVNDTEDAYPTNHGPVIVFEQYTEIDEETGEEVLVFDASESYDPDGESTGVTYSWTTTDGQVIGEESILRLPINSDLLPATLTMLDDSGEMRVLELNLLNIMNYLGAMGIALGVALTIALAMIAYLKYTPSAPSKASHTPMPVKKPSSKPKAVAKKKTKSRK